MHLHNDKLPLYVYTHSAHHYRKYNRDWPPIMSSCHSGPDGCLGRWFSCTESCYKTPKCMQINVCCNCKLEITRYFPSTAAIQSHFTYYIEIDRWLNAAFYKQLIAAIQRTIICKLADQTTTIRGNKRNPRFTPLCGRSVSSKGKYLIYSPVP